MSLQVQDVALEAIAALRPLMPLIRRSDRSLADQLSRAASSVVLNIAEGAYSDPGNRRARYFSAAGSANEARAALRVAVTWATSPPRAPRPPSNCSTVSLPCCGA